MPDRPYGIETPDDILRDIDQALLAALA